MSRWNTWSESHNYTKEFGIIVEVVTHYEEDDDWSHYNGVSASESSYEYPPEKLKHLRWEYQDEYKHKLKLNNDFACIWLEDLPVKFFELCCPMIDRPYPQKPNIPKYYFDNNGLIKEIPTLSPDTKLKEIKSFCKKHNVEVWLSDERKKSNWLEAIEESNISRKIAAEDWLTYNQELAWWDNYLSELYQDGKLPAKNENETNKNAQVLDDYEQELKDYHEELSDLELAILVSERNLTKIKYEPDKWKAEYIDEYGDRLNKEGLERYLRESQIETEKDLKELYEAKDNLVKPN